MKTGASRTNYLAALIVCWIISRCVYFFYFRVSFDSRPLTWYLQYIDPALLKTALLQSTFYLRDQPPGFNLFLGVILQCFGDYADRAFQGTYLAFGLGLAIVLFSCLLRMGALPALAFIIVALFSMSPITLLYENWLFYTYPLTFLLALAALFLHRYIANGRTVDGVVFSSTIALIVLSRGIFHLAWFVLILCVLWLLRAANRRQIVIATAVPCLVLGTYSCKNYFVFGTLFSGEIYQKTNLAMMMYNKLPSSVIQQLVAQGQVTELATLSPYSLNNPYNLDLDQYRRLLPPIKRWGIPVLDQEVKSTGFTNWQSQLMVEFARVYYRDAMIAVRQYPMAYLHAIVSNVLRYFMPADEVWPFPDVNGTRVRKLLGAWHVLLAGQVSWLGIAPWFNVLTFPACFLYGCFYVGQWALSRGGASQGLRNADAAVVLFILYNIAYVGAVTVLFSVSDHNRYRFKVSPFYAVLFGLLVTAGVQHLRVVLSRSARAGDLLDQHSFG